MGMGSLSPLYCPARGWLHVIVSERHAKPAFAQIIRWLLDEHFLTTAARQKLERFYRAFPT